MDKLSAIIKKLEQYEIKINTKDINNKVIYSNDFIVGVMEDGSIVLYFNVTTRAEDAAIVALILKEVRVIGTSGKLKIGEAFYINETGYIWGDDAYNAYDEMKKRITINRYNRDKYQEQILEDDSRCYHC